MVLLYLSDVNLNEEAYQNNNNRLVDFKQANSVAHFSFKSKLFCLGGQTNRNAA